MSLGTLSHRWQTTIADLSLILFLLAASALGRDPVAKLAEADANPPTAPAQGVALNLWQDRQGAIALADWLAEQVPDNAQRMVITVTYPPGGLDAALAQIGRLRQLAGTRGANARISLAPGARASVQVQLVQEAVPPPADPQRETGPELAS